MTVTCRVLEIARQPYYRWLACSVTDVEWDKAHLANAVFDAHRDDPEFGNTSEIASRREVACRLGAPPAVQRARNTSKIHPAGGFHHQQP